MALQVLFAHLLHISQAGTPDCCSSVTQWRNRELPCMPVQLAVLVMVLLQYNSMTKWTQWMCRILQTLDMSISRAEEFSGAPHFTCRVRGARIRGHADYDSM